MRAAQRSLVTLICVALAACAADLRTPPVAAQEDPNDPTVRIGLYEAKLKQDPTLFAAHAELGSAYLDLARETHDVAWLGKARSELQRSLAIQPNVNALATLASLCNFSHRFACALEN